MVLDELIYLSLHVLHGGQSTSRRRSSIFVLSFKSKVLMFLGFGKLVVFGFGLSVVFGFGTLIW